MTPALLPRTDPRYQAWYTKMYSGLLADIRERRAVLERQGVRFAPRTLSCGHVCEVRIDRKPSWGCPDCRRVRYAGRPRRAAR